VIVTASGVITTTGPDPARLPRRVLDKRRDIAGQVVLALTATTRAGVAPGATTIPGAWHRRRAGECALQAAAHPPHRLGEVAHLGRSSSRQSRCATHSVSCRWRTRRRTPPARTELGEILDDPVVDHTNRQSSKGADGRCGRWGRHGCPPGVPDGVCLRRSPSWPGAVAGRPPISAGPRRMPVARSASAFSRLASFPACFSTSSSSPETTATPAESYRGTPAVAARPERFPAPPGPDIHDAHTQRP